MNQGNYIGRNLRVVGLAFLTVILWCSNGFGYYQAEKGRWISRDPIGERGGVGVYGYVLNSPIISIDPVGFEICVIKPGGIRICVGMPNPDPPIDYPPVEPDPPKPLGDTSDYCGPAGNWLGAFIVPDKPFGFNFRPCCKAHDECYDKCGSSKAKCDIELGNCMRNVANAQANIFRPEKLGEALAILYQKAVEWGACSAYKAAQKHCDCPGECK
jgi:RHS repeat-associated protein